MIRSANMRVNWKLQQLNLGGMTSGPAAVGDPSSFIYANQSHVLYRDATDPGRKASSTASPTRNIAGKIWDCWYDGQHWNLQQINLGGVTSGPAAVGDPSSFLYAGESQSHVLYRDAAGKIWDSWYDGQHWNLQQINLSGMTPGPAAVGDPCSFIFANQSQSHILYRDAAGKIWDSWYDGQHWNLQQINLGGETSGPATVGDPSSFVSAFVYYANQSHILYRDAAGKVWDSWYDSPHWNLQQINLGGMTPGPAAVGDPSSFIYADESQSHVLYRDATGKIWDSWSQALAPVSPTGMHVVSISVGPGNHGSTVDVSWTDNSDDENGFLINYEGTLAGNSNDTGQITLAANRVNASLALTSDYTYTIHVQAFNSAGSSDFSAASNWIEVKIPSVPVTTSISASVENVSPSYGIYGLVVIGSGFQNGESIQVLITWSVDGGNSATQSLASTAGLSGGFSLNYLGNTGEGFCSDTGYIHVYTFQVHATGLTSHRTASTTAQHQC